MHTYQNNARGRNTNRALIIRQKRVDCSWMQMSRAACFSIVLAAPADHHHWELSPSPVSVSTVVHLCPLHHSTPLWIISPSAHCQKAHSQVCMWQCVWVSKWAMPTGRHNCHCCWWWSAEIEQSNSNNNTSLIIKSVTNLQGYRWRQLVPLQKQVDTL